MGKTGKCRIENRERYACGKLKPETASPTLVRRIIDQAKRGAGDPLFGTALGMLRLADKLTDRQVAAGTRYAEICGTYDRIKGIPRRTAASPSYQVGLGKSHGTDLEDEFIIAELARCAGDKAAVARSSPKMRAIVRATVRHDAAQAVLMGCGEAAFKAVRQLCVFDDAVEYWRRPQLVRGLDALHSHFELTGAWK